MIEISGFPEVTRVTGVFDVILHNMFFFPVFAKTVTSLKYINIYSTSIFKYNLMKLYVENLEMIQHVHKYFEYFCKFIL
jgi:hypothetical protein